MTRLVAQGEISLIANLFDSTYCMTSFEKHERNREKDPHRAAPFRKSFCPQCGLVPSQFASMKLFALNCEEISQYFGDIDV